MAGPRHFTKRHRQGSRAQLSSSSFPLAPALAYDRTQKKRLAKIQASVTGRVPRPTETMPATTGINATQVPKSQGKATSEKEQSCPGGWRWPRARSLCSLPPRWHLNRLSRRKNIWGILHLREEVGWAASPV